MYEIQFPTAMSVLLNETKSSMSGAKVDCAKECPCGVPAIPVPDQWLEVMVTGGFKVWHIIFIIIAFVVTLVVVYCCFHRCRIPRTKQEIEADLMRTNLTTKFRDYLQEFPNEPTTFIDALKRVQELEEKTMDNDDSVAKKRMGWLKLKGKDRAEKEQDQASANAKSEATNGADSNVAQVASSEQDKSATKEATTEGEPSSRRTEKQSMFAARIKEQAKLQVNSSLADDEEQVKKRHPNGSDLQLPKGQSTGKTSNPKQSTSIEQLPSKSSGSVAMYGKDDKSKRKAKGEKDKSEANPVAGIENDKNNDNNATSKRDQTKEESNVSSGLAKVAKVRRRRADKPGLKRTKATHSKFTGGESSELVPTVSQLHVTTHSHERGPAHSASSHRLELPLNTDNSRKLKSDQSRTVRLIKSKSSKPKSKEPAGKTSTTSFASTVIHIPSEQ